MDRQLVSGQYSDREPRSQLLSLLAENRRGETDVDLVTVGRVYISYDTLLFKLFDCFFNSAVKPIRLVYLFHLIKEYWGETFFEE